VLLIITFRQSVGSASAHAGEWGFMARGPESTGGNWIIQTDEHYLRNQLLL
jgi:hypothetical protein